MTIHIYTDKTLASGQSQTALNSKTTSSVLKTEAITPTKKIHENLEKSENSIQISHEAKFLNSYLNSTPTENIDWDKVNKIKNQINSGEYALNYEKIAEKLIDFENKIV